MEIMDFLSGKTILCLATQDWEANRTTCQHLMMRLTPQNRVVYFEPFRHLFSKNRKKPPSGNGKSSQLLEVKPNLFIHHPRYPYFPWNMKSALAGAINSLMYKLEISNLLKKLHITNPILWAFFAQSLSVLEIPNEYFIYDCVDDWQSFFPNPAEKRFVSQIDHELCRRADLIFVGSDPLFKMKSQINPK